MIFFVGILEQQNIVLFKRRALTHIHINIYKRFECNINDDVKLYNPKNKQFPYAHITHTYKKMTRTHKHQDDIECIEFFYIN